MNTKIELSQQNNKQLGKPISPCEEDAEYRYCIESSCFWRFLKFKNEHLGSKLMFTSNMTKYFIEDLIKLCWMHWGLFHETNNEKMCMFLTSVLFKNRSTCLYDEGCRARDLDPWKWRDWCKTRCWSTGKGLNPSTNTVRITLSYFKDNCISWSACLEHV